MGGPQINNNQAMIEAQQRAEAARRAAAEAAARLKAQQEAEQARRQAETGQPEAAPTGVTQDAFMADPQMQAKFQGNQEQMKAAFEEAAALDGQDDLSADELEAMFVAEATGQTIGSQQEGVVEAYQRKAEEQGGQVADGLMAREAQDARAAQDATADGQCVAVYDDADVIAFETFAADPAIQARFGSDPARLQAVYDQAASKDEKAGLTRAELVGLYRGGDVAASRPKPSTKEAAESQLKERVDQLKGVFDEAKTEFENKQGELGERIKALADTDTSRMTPVEKLSHDKRLGGMNQQLAQMNKQADKFEAADRAFGAFETASAALGEGKIDPAALSKLSGDLLGATSALGSLGAASPGFRKVARELGATKELLKGSAELLGDLGKVAGALGGAADLASGMRALATGRDEDGKALEPKEYAEKFFEVAKTMGDAGDNVEGLQSLLAKAAEHPRLQQVGKALLETLPKLGQGMTTLASKFGGERGAALAGQLVQRLEGAFLNALSKGAAGLNNFLSAVGKLAGVIGGFVERANPWMFAADMGLRQLDFVLKDLFVPALQGINQAFTSVRYGDGTGQIGVDPNARLESVEAARQTLADQQGKADPRQLQQHAAMLCDQADRALDIRPVHPQTADTFDANALRKQAAAQLTPEAAQLYARFQKDPKSLSGPEKLALAPALAEASSRVLAADMAGLGNVPRNLDPKLMTPAIAEALTTSKGGIEVAEQYLVGLEKAGFDKLPADAKLALFKGIADTKTGKDFLMSEHSQAVLGNLAASLVKQAPPDKQQQMVQDLLGMTEANIRGPVANGIVQGMTRAELDAMGLGARQDLAGALRDAKTLIGLGMKDVPGVDLLGMDETNFKSLEAVSESVRRTNGSQAADKLDATGSRNLDDADSLAEEKVGTLSDAELDALPAGRRLALIETLQAGGSYGAVGDGENAATARLVASEMRVAQRANPNNPEAVTQAYEDAMSRAGGPLGTRGNRQAVAGLVVDQLTAGGDHGSLDALPPQAKQAIAADLQNTYLALGADDARRSAQLAGSLRQNGAAWNDAAAAIETRGGQGVFASNEGVMATAKVEALSDADLGRMASGDRQALYKQLADRGLGDPQAVQAAARVMNAELDAAGRAAGPAGQQQALTAMLAQAPASKRADLATQAVNARGPESLASLAPESRQALGDTILAATTAIPGGEGQPPTEVPATLTPERAQALVALTESPSGDLAAKLARRLETADGPSVANLAGARAAKLDGAGFDQAAQGDQGLALVQQLGRGQPVDHALVARAIDAMVRQAPPAQQAALMKAALESLPSFERPSAVVALVGDNQREALAGKYPSAVLGAMNDAFKSGYGITMKADGASAEKVRQRLDGDDGKSAMAIRQGMEKAWADADRLYQQMATTPPAQLPQAALAFQGEHDGNAKLMIQHARTPEQREAARAMVTQLRDAAAAQLRANPTSGAARRSLQGYDRALADTAG